MVRKTYTSELRRGPDPAPGRPGEGPREPGRTCAWAVFCLENSMSAHKKCSNFFLRQDFCLIFFVVGKLWTCSIHFWQNKQLRSPEQKSRAPNVPHGGKIKKIILHLLCMNLMEACRCGFRFNRWMMMFWTISNALTSAFPP